MKKKSPADINARNAEFWAEIKSRVDPLLKDSELVETVVNKQALDLVRTGGMVRALNSLECDLLDEHKRREGAKALDTLAERRESQLKNQKKATAGSRKYGDSDKAKWQGIADKLSASLSKNRKAEIIAERLKLPSSAAHTIRKAIK